MNNANANAEFIKQAIAEQDRRSAERMFQARWELFLRDLDPDIAAGIRAGTITIELPPGQTVADLLDLWFGKKPTRRRS